MGPCRLLKTIFAQFLGKYRVVSALFGKIERLTFTGTFDAFQHLVKSHSFKQICFPHRSEMGVLKSFPRSTSLSWNPLISRAVNAARNVSDSITGEPSLSRRWWSTRRTGAESAFVASVLGTRRSLPLTAPVSLQETRTTTACVRFRQASAIRATCLLRTT